MNKIYRGKKRIALKNVSMKWRRYVMHALSFGVRDYVYSDSTNKYVRIEKIKIRLSRRAGYKHRYVMDVLFFGDDCLPGHISASLIEHYWYRYDIPVLKRKEEIEK